MAHGKNKKVPPSPRFTIDGNINHVAIYHTMIFSKAWQDLSPKQQQLYICMKIAAWRKIHNQKTGINETKDLLYYKDNNDGLRNVGIDELFYFNADRWQKKPGHVVDAFHFGLYSNLSQFYKDRDALIEHGFIKEVFSGRKTRDKSIYSFSDGWKAWQEQKQ